MISEVKKRRPMRKFSEQEEIWVSSAGFHMFLTVMQHLNDGTPCDFREVQGQSYGDVVYDLDAMVRIASSCTKGVYVVEKPNGSRQIWVEDAESDFDELRPVTKCGLWHWPECLTISEADLQDRLAEQKRNAKSLR